MKLFDNTEEQTYQALECPLGYVCFQQRNLISSTEADCKYCPNKCLKIVPGWEERERR